MTATKALEQTVLQPGKRSSDVVEFEAKLRDLIVGQDEALSELVNVYQSMLAGLTTPGRPLANLLVLGPTGSGKTRLVEALAETLFGGAEAIIKVDCAEFQQSHEISKLIGSPPGYIGHRETPPLFTQETIDRCHTEKLKLSIVLFDEIEKASEALWQLLLGILDKGTLTLGDNRKVNMSRTIIFMTSNLGAAEIARMMTGGIGFAPPRLDEPSAQLEEKVHRLAVEAARKRFSPEFMNRLDKVLVFRPLNKADLEKILEIELRAVQKRIFTTQSERPFVLWYSQRAKEFLLSEGTDSRYGARPLKRAIERHVVVPISSLLASGQILAGDTVTADVPPDGHELLFTKLKPTLRPLTNGASNAGSSTAVAAAATAPSVSFPFGRVA
jgi:ATP-dependent Clp protease ATP-binding subunit ClpA